jgi:5-enolpyruvylshikimate-3-phosphate synthase
MRRVTAPLSRMGARFTEHSGDGLPLTVHGATLEPLRHELSVSSAQVKSALLLAGLAAAAARLPDARRRSIPARVLRRRRTRSADPALVSDG